MGGGLRGQSDVTRAAGSDDGDRRGQYTRPGVADNVARAVHENTARHDAQNIKTFRALCRNGAARPGVCRRRD